MSFPRARKEEQLQLYQSRASKRGSTNSTCSFAETRFENQSRAHRGASRSTKIIFEK
jgi:hypothetical protein